MKVFIVGGTGFLGYYSALEFLKKGHETATISLPDIELGDWFPSEVDVKYGNVFEMDKDELKELFQGYDAIVYAVGPDDRVKPIGRAYDFFHERLVEACGRVVAGARQAGVKRCVILNSYFAYFDRIWPKQGLAEHHPYIKCRVEQAERVIGQGKDVMDVMVLELPYIFGSMPERVPLWKDILVKMLHDNKLILFPKGGTNMIAVEHIGEAVVGAAEKGRHGKRYTIGDVNISWVDMIRMMLESMGMADKKIVTLPKFLMNIQARKMKKKEKKEGYEAGLNPLYLFNDIICRFMYFDADESIRELGYGRGGIGKAIDKTIKACIIDM